MHMHMVFCVVGASETINRIVLIGFLRLPCLENYSVTRECCCGSTQT